MSGNGVVALARRCACLLLTAAEFAEQYAEFVFIVAVAASGVSSAATTIWSEGRGKEAAMGTPAVFIHGMFLHATSWTDWAELFQAKGYRPAMPGWPHEPDTVSQARQQSAVVAGVGIDAIVGHYAQLIRSLHARPVIIGHSTGALVAQRLLGEGLATAAVALQPPPIKGLSNVEPASVPVGWPLLRKPSNRRRTIALTPR